jgi:phage shock protein A
VIFKKFWSAIRAQLNKLANVFWEADPIAQMRYEYDAAVEELKTGRLGLEQYRGLVEKVTRQVREGERHLAKLQAQTKAYLKVGDRETAARFALEVQKAKAELAQNSEQLATHEKAYDNNLKKIKHANKSLAEIREKIERYDAELKMSEAEAEIAKLSESFDFNVTTDFGELEQVLQGRIDQNRGAVRVASDLSERGIAEIDAQEAMEATLAEDALRELELEMGLVSPATINAPEVEKQLGPVSETSPIIPIIEEQS